MFSLKTHAIICAALFAAIVAIATGGNALQAAGVIHDLGAFKLPFMIVVFALFLAFGFSAVPVMVKIVLGFQRKAGAETVPVVATAPRAETWIIYAIWALMAAGVAVALPAAIKGGLFDQAGGGVWVTDAAGAAVTAVDAASGAVTSTILTGPHPRFLAAGDGAIWTLDQGDGALTEIDARTRRRVRTVALGTPGHGGDIKIARGVVWTTMAHVPLTATDAATGKVLRQWVGKGGDSLAVGGGAIWLTDYAAGAISRIEVRDALGGDRARRR